MTNQPLIDFAKIVYSVNGLGRGVYKIYKKNLKKAKRFFHTIVDWFKLGQPMNLQSLFWNRKNAKIISCTTIVIGVVPKNV